MQQVVTYAVEDFDEALPEIKKLVPDHGEEVGIKDLNVDFETFSKINGVGNLLCYVARHDKKIVGYVIGFATHDLHRKHVKQIVFQDYYVAKDFRKSGVAIHMFRSIEDMLESGGKLEEMHVTSKLKFDKLFEMLGWVKVDHIYSKVLNHV